MSTYPRRPFRQSGAHRPFIHGGVVRPLMRGMTARGMLLAFVFGIAVAFVSGLLFASCEYSFAPAAQAAPVTTQAATGHAPNSVVVIPMSGAIGPASADFIVRSLQRAADDHAQLAVLQLDTPGGLDTSMRQIIKAILGSPVPVATFIAPSGARAASAGTYIVYASHIAAMAPGTNLGAATPIQMGIGGAEPPGREKPGLPGLPGTDDREPKAPASSAGLLPALHPPALPATLRAARRVTPLPAAQARSRSTLNRQNCASRSTTPLPTSAASRKCAGATPIGPNARCAKR